MAQNERKVNKTDNEAAVVVIQFVERLLSTTESRVRIQSSAKLMLNIYCQLYRKDENTEKVARNGPLKKQPYFFANNSLPLGATT